MKQETKALDKMSKKNLLNIGLEELRNFYLDKKL